MKMRKIISLLLALVMVCSIIPFAVFAEGEATSVTFDFSTLTGKNVDITSNAKSVFSGCASDASVLTAVTTSKIYNGNGDGGWKPQSSGFLKTGTSSKNGEINMTFTKKATKVELVCHAWNTGKTDSIAVNGGSSKTAPNAGSFETLTFEITASETVKIVTSKRTFIQSITVTFEGATGGEDPAPETPAVEYAEIADGTYLFVTDGKAMSNLTQDKTYGYPGYANVTVTDGVATGYANTDLFTITNVEGGFTIQDSYGRYYYLSGTFNSFNVSADIPAEGHIWQAEVTEGGVLIVNVLKEKTLAYSAQYSSFGIYADQSSVMTLVAATAITEPEVPEVPEEPKVEYAEIADGTYLIVTDGKAMSNLDESKNYGYPLFTEVTVTDGVATGYANTDLFTITNVEGGFTIQDSYGRYYYLSGTYNSFNVSAEVPAEGHIWQAEVTEGGVLIVNVLKEKTLAYDSGYSSFGIYSDKSSVITLVAATAITEPEVPENPENPEDPEVPEEPVVPETLAEQIAEAEKLNNGEYLPYESTISGTIIDEPTPSSRTEGQYKFTVSDGTNTILCYYTPVADGVVPAKGDSATVVGKLTAYNGTAQFDETAIAVVVNNVPEQPGTGDQSPETSGVSIAAMAILSVLSGSALVLLKKKEF